ncbi:MAG: ComEC family competence protein [Candidatus Azobacteroides sp.]|nr:ComEC family competence protein [Candidatus Azobacteroides sp.]
MTYRNRFIFGGLFGIAIILFFLATGTFIFTIQDKKTVWNFSEQECTYLTRLIEDPIEKNTTVLCKLKVMAVITDSSYFPIKRNIIAYLPKNDYTGNLQPGEELIICASIKPPEENKNPTEFNYAFYLKQQGISGISYIKENNYFKTRKQIPFNPRYKALQCRKKLLDIFDTLPLDKDEKAILSAITLGYKNDLTPEIKNTFSVTGASHILAVSGLHVGIIFMFTGFLLSFFQRNNLKTRLIKYTFIILILWGFAFITGLSPSVIRATCMFSISLIATILNKRNSTFNSICIAAFCMLLYNPYYLFDVSFQLSYSAVASIVILNPYLQKLIPVKQRFLSAVWSLVTVSITAQAGTFPFVLYYFHQFPTYFILTNLLVIPLTYLILINTSIILIAEFIGGNFHILKDILVYIVTFLKTGVSTIEYLPGASFRNIWIHPLEVLTLFLIIINLVYFLLKKRIWGIYFFLIGISGLLISTIIKTYQTETQSYIIFYRQKGTPGINLIDGHTNYLLTENPSQTYFLAKDEWIKNKVKAPLLLTSTFSNAHVVYHENYIQYKNTSIYLVKSNELASYYPPSYPLKVNYLLIAKGCSLPLSSLLSYIVPEKILLDASLSGYVTDMIKQECKQENISYYDISEKGYLKIKNIQ